MTKIAEITGYQSVSAFSTAFKHQTGLSPTLHVQTLQMTLSTKRIRQAADQSAADQKNPPQRVFLRKSKPAECCAECS
jgi:AraC-like DNA-binding protein